MTNNSITDIKKCSKCDKKVIARGLCGKHYQEAIKYGYITKLSTPNIKERLNDSSEKVTESGCQIWTGSVINTGYGIISVSNKRLLAHRVSYETYVGKIQKGMVVCHKCDNPSCINPNHLFLGTHKENMNDMVTKNRQSKGEGRTNIAKLTDEQIEKIRKDNRVQNVIAIDYGITQSNVSRIKNKNRWTHI